MARGQVIPNGNRADGKGFYRAIEGNGRPVFGIFLLMNDAGTKLAHAAFIADDAGYVSVVGRGAGADFARLGFVENDDGASGEKATASKMQVAAKSEKPIVFFMFLNIFFVK